MAAKMDEAARRRVRAGRLLLKGKKPAEVAATVGAPRQTVYRWLSQKCPGKCPGLAIAAWHAFRNSSRHDPEPFRPILRCLSLP
ncbi:MAG: helix-turn-helix domain-containing protein [Zoogloeaceae bacterium]|nr:helix-turn-helix domain-containing protein [Zoogloeaceae bacterium]